MTETLIVERQKLLDAIEAELLHHFGLDLWNYEAKAIGLDVIRRLAVAGRVPSKRKKFRQPETMAS